jgi:RNase P/RNase MRP subunit p29
MSEIFNLPWISRSISVTDSNDPTLIGLSGIVMDETKRTISLSTNGKSRILAKNVIKFTIDNIENEMDGKLFSQRSEERINRKYRRN